MYHAMYYPKTHETGSLPVSNAAFGLAGWSRSGRTALCFGVTH